jgi:hypothetical protein
MVMSILLCPAIFFACPIPNTDPIPVKSPAPRGVNAESLPMKAQSNGSRPQEVLQDVGGISVNQTVRFKLIGCSTKYEGLVAVSDILAIVHEEERVPKSSAVVR